MMKKQNGITLIALVITIIVLLILAGVSIAMLTGENGVLTKATESTTKTKEGEVEEAIKLGVAEIIADNQGFPVGGIKSSDLSTSIAKMNNNYTFSATDDTAEGVIKVVATPTKGDDITRYVQKTSGKVSETNTFPSTGGDTENP